MRSSVALLCVLGAFLTGCGDDASNATADDAGSVAVTGVDGDATPWTEFDAIEDDGDFRFAVVSDRTGEHREAVFASAMPKINLVSPDFVVSVGDLIEGYTDDPATLAHEWDEIEGYVGGLDMPFFYAAGNHDMSNEVMALEWQKRFGPSYYAFEYEDVLFLVLNSELFGMVHDPKTPVPGPYSQEEQLVFAEKTLAENTDVRWTFVIVHQPLWDGGRGVHPDWEKIETMLGERPFTVFAGHYHSYTTHLRSGREYITLATTGGGSDLRGLPFGEFDHVAHVTMTEDGPIIANLLLDGIHGSLVRTEDVRNTVGALDRAVSAEAMVGDGALFRDGIARFTVTNPGSTPLQVIGRFATGRDIEPLVKEVRRTVPPGGVAQIEVPYHAPGRPVAYERLAPARVTWNLATRQDDVPIEIETYSIVHPERPFSLAAAPAPITVDGKLGDWSALPFVVDEPGELTGHGPHGGAADASFRFGLTHDAENLYLAVDVTDTSVVASSDRIAREQDSVSISVDARPDPDRSANSGLFEALRSGAMRKIVTAMVTLEEPKADPIMALFGASAPEGLAYASERTARGYSVEFAIPTASLDAARGAPWDELRINVGLADFDDNEPDHTVVQWRANRFGGHAPEGSGVFLRR